MNQLLSEDSLFRFVEHNPFDSYGFYVTVPQTVTHQYLGDNGWLYGYGTKHKLDLGILGIIAKFFPSNEPNRNLIGIESSFSFSDCVDTTLAERIKRDSYISGFEFYEDSTLRNVEDRVSLLLSFSIALLMPQSRINVISNTDITNNIIPKLYYDEVIELLEYKGDSYIHLDGRFENDVSQVFQWLWFHYPQNLTGFDERLKGISLEELSKK